eukprot:862807_1
MAIIQVIQVLQSMAIIYSVTNCNEPWIGHGDDHWIASIKRIASDGSYKWRRWVVAVIVRQWIHPCTGQILFVYGIRGRRGMEALDVAGRRWMAFNIVLLLLHHHILAHPRDFIAISMAIGCSASSSTACSTTQPTKRPKLSKERAEPAKHSKTEQRPPEPPKTEQRPPEPPKTVQRRRTTPRQSNDHQNHPKQSNDHQN